MQVRALNKVNHTLHKLSATAMVFRPIVQIDHESREVGKTLTHRFPPLLDTVCQTIAGDFGDDAVEKHFIQARQQQTHRGQGGLGLEIVIRSLRLGSTFAATRKRSHFDRGFGIYGDPKDIGFGIRLTIDLTQVVEDGVGLWNFF